MADRSVTDTDDNLKSLVKVLRILECFSTTDRALSLAEIRTATGLPKSTAHRLLASMREVGFLDQDRQRDRYRLGLKLFELGNVVLANMELHREARPLMDALGRLSGQTVHLAVFDGRQAVVIHRATPAPGAATPLVFLEAAPAHCTSVGKAVLAFQPPEVIERLIAGGLAGFTERTITGADALRQECALIRGRGYAVDDGEHQPGLRCVGAPIRDAAGRVFAGLSVSGPAREIALSEVEALSRIVVHHADAISARLGHRGD
jgi:DNA-binding IclR family transcriptional regulator